MFVYFFNLIVLFFILNFSRNPPVVSSVIAIFVYLVVTLYFLWRFEFKREIRDSGKIYRTLEMGRFITNSKNRDKLYFWIFCIPKEFFFSSLLLFKLKRIFYAENTNNCISSNNKDSKKIVLITGGATGIGYELSRLFARNNYDLILVSRDKDRLNEVSVELQRDFNVKISIISKDLSKYNSAHELYHDVCRTGHKVDILVNNAGIANYGKFTESDIERQVNLIQLNTTSLTVLCRLFGRDMALSKSGAILNVASIAAFQAGPLMSTYYASKAYVLLFSEALQKELQEDGVKVTVLCPGPTKTGFFQRNNWTGSKVETHHYLMSAEDVAKCGYRGLFRGKTIVIPGVINKLAVFTVRFLPRAVVNIITCYLNKGH